MPINLGRITAIDMHVHVERDEHGNYSLDEELLAASARYFKAGADRAPSLAEIAAYYRERRLAAVVFTVDAHTATGHPALSSEEITAGAAAHADVLIPFGSVDPHDGPGAVSRLVLFGSDHPLISPDRWLAGFADLEIKPDVRPLILKHNAARVLGLADRES